MKKFVLSLALIASGSVAFAQESAIFDPQVSAGSKIDGASVGRDDFGNGLCACNLSEVRLNPDAPILPSGAPAPSAPSKGTKGVQ